MPVSADIYGAIQPPKQQDPLNAMARAMQIQGLQQDQQMGRLRVDEYQRGIGDKNRMATILGQAYAKPEEREDALLRGGFVDQATKLATDRRANTKSDAETDSKKLETSGKRIDLMGQTLGWVRQNPTAQNAAQAVQFMVENGIMPADKGQEALAKFSADPSPQAIASFAEMGFRAALSAKEQLLKTQTNNIGGQTVTQAIDPVTGKAAQVSAIQNTQSPDNAATNARTAADNAASRSVQMRGQNMTDGRAREQMSQSERHFQAGQDAPKLGEGAKKQVTGIDALHSAIEEYKAELQNWGKTDIARPDKRAAMGTKYKNMMLQAKEAYNLGVLNGPDLEILTSVVTDPASLKGTITSNEALGNQASELDRMMQRTRSAVTNQGRGGPAVPAAATTVAAKPAQGGLSAEEQKELVALRKRFGK